MCSKPQIPDAPPVTAVPEPPQPEETAQEVDLSLEDRRRDRNQNRTLLSQYDLPYMPPNFRIPR